MAASLTASYGTLGVMAGRFLYPADGSELGWRYVTTVDQLAVGEAMVFESPTGAKIVVARQGASIGSENFIALSSVCPHLGCQVHWEAHQRRFVCPCHNGIFNERGQATSGPPADAGQSLTRYPLKIEQEMLFIQVPLQSLIDTSPEISVTESLHELKDETKIA